MPEALAAYLPEELGAPPRDMGAGRRHPAQPAPVGQQGGDALPSVRAAVGRLPLKVFRQQLLVGIGA